MKVDTVIKNCKIAGVEGTSSAGVAIDNGKIVAIALDENLPSANRVIDAKGNYAIPGLIDPHIHFGFPPKCDLAANIREQTRQMAYAGVTTCVHMHHRRGFYAPGTFPQETADRVQWNKEFVKFYEKHGYIDLGLTSRISSRDDIPMIKPLADFGVVGFKFQMAYKGEEALPGTPEESDDDLMYLVFQEIARVAKDGYKVHCRVHCENIRIILMLKQLCREKGVQPKNWMDVRPNFTEAEAMHRAIFMAKITGCPLCIVHMTIGEGVDIVRKAKADGVNIIVETCPQHLTLNVENSDPFLSKTNPPIRRKEDNERLWEGIRDGVIDLMGTDNAPYPWRERKKDLLTSEVGISTIDVWLPIMLDAVNKGKISLEKLIEVTSYNAAKFYGYLPQKGIVCVGSDADLVMVDLNREITWEDKPAYSPGDYHTWAGWKFKGCPVLAMVRGTVVMEDRTVIGNPGFGRFIPSKAK